MGARFFPLAVAGLVVCGCTSGGVVFDVHTDLVPDVELDEIVLSTPAATLRVPVSHDDAWLRGVRIAALASPEGLVALTAEARLDGNVVVRESLRVNVRGTAVVPIWLLRSCLDVACPPDGAPDAVACRDGHCVPPDCVPGAPECPLGCTTAADCPPAAASCARAACLESHCVIEPIAGACPAGAHCDPTTGCAGVPLDAGTPDGGVCIEDASCGVDALLHWLNVARATARTCGTTAMPAVPALTANATLESVALDHASYMASAHELTLTGPGATTPQSRATAAGYAYRFLLPGAFVMGYEETLEGVVDQMLADPSLCAQVMAASPNEFGAAGVDGAPDGIYWAWYAGDR